MLRRRVREEGGDPARLPSGLRGDDGGLCLDGKLWLGGELDAMGRFATTDEERARNDLRIFLGYSGWGAGQLDDELRGGTWLPADEDSTSRSTRPLFFAPSATEADQSMRRINELHSPA